MSNDEPGFIWAPWPAGERRTMADLEAAIETFRTLPESQKRLFRFMCVWNSAAAKALVLSQALEERETSLIERDVDEYLDDFAKRRWTEPWLGGPGSKLNYFGRCMGKAMGMEMG